VWKKPSKEGSSYDYEYVDVGELTFEINESEELVDSLSKKLKFKMKDAYHTSNNLEVNYLLDENDTLVMIPANVKENEKNDTLAMIPANVKKNEKYFNSTKHWEYKGKHWKYKRKILFGRYK